MKMSDAFPSKYLRAGDLSGDTLAVIAEAEYAMLDNERKPILLFQSGKAPDGKFIALKPMVLNKTNFKTISNIIGSDDTDDWIGREIVLISRMVEFKDEMVPGLRVRAPKGSTPLPEEPRTKRQQTVVQREKYELSSGNGLPADTSLDDF